MRRFLFVLLSNSAACARQLFREIGGFLAGVLVCGVNCQILFPGLQCQLVAAGGFEDVGKACQRREITRLFFEGQVDVGHCLAGITIGKMHHGAAIRRLHIVRVEQNDLVEKIISRRVPLFVRGFAGPLHQEIDRRAAGIVPFGGDLVGDAARLDCVALFFQRCEKSVDRLGRGRRGFCRSRLLSIRRMANGGHSRNQEAGKQETLSEEDSRAKTIWAHGLKLNPTAPNIKCKLLHCQQSDPRVQSRTAVAIYQP
ncbi:exported hypothetical protein [Agrobacterium sp. NCPPB 925]|nr:exported hypothetical protein [Agrobacterium sp. NCPPB 925]